MRTGGGVVGPMSREGGVVPEGSDSSAGGGGVGSEGDT